MADLRLAVESPCRKKGFDRTAMVIVGEAFVMWYSGRGRHAARDSVVAEIWDVVCDE